ncbi:MAG TPA: MBL fold metallo-hydrolase [Candidatus Dormibacteraeota bacterium]|nr:MBL fold metallo-hydrolase [Candidatus Dormibacteraeota bacterium]
MLPRSYPVEYRRGLHLPLAGLWLDPRERRDLAVVSHAHGDHIARHRAVVCTEATYRLMVHRIGAVEPHVLRFGVERAVDGAEGCALSLHPAGHILGAAQVLVRHAGLRVLYSGDIRTRPSLTCPPLERVEADVLVVETTFGHQRYRFPHPDEVIPGVVRFCTDGLAAGEVPVLLAYSLGKAQELLFQLADSGLRVLLHPVIHAIACIYRGLGVDLPPAARLDEEDDLDLFAPPQPGGAPSLARRVPRDSVVVVPPHLRDARCVRRLAPVRRAALTGWAVDPSTVDRLGCDAAFPLSDHCDFDDLVAYTLATRARRVYTIHGFAQDFARHLRSRGVEASALLEAEQLPLLLA